MFKTFKNLSPKTRAGVGLAIIAWGATGLYLSDQAEEKFGYTPTEADKAAIDKYTPKIYTVDREDETK